MISSVGGYTAFMITDRVFTPVSESVEDAVRGTVSAAAISLSVFAALHDEGIPIGTLPIDS